MSESQQPEGPPYLPTTWSLGGRPEVKVDIPITVIFLVLFIGGAALHMTLFQTNRSKGHKFLFSIAIFGFCMARIITCIMRIASTCLPHDVSLAIAAQIFTAAGVVVLFIVNLFFAERVVRATHPRVGWNLLFSNTLRFLYALIIATIIILITAVVQSFYTLNTSIHRIDRDITLYGVTTFAILSFLPIPIMIVSLLIPRSQPLDKFGTGRWRHKAIILLIGSTLISFGACYRAGVSWLPAVAQTQALPGILGKGPFYIVNFTIEVLVIYLYGSTRVDQRFHVADHASVYKNYSKASEHNARATSATSQVETSMGRDIEKDAHSGRAYPDQQK